jgi:hypothetical protein
LLLSEGDLFTASKHWTWLSLENFFLRFRHIVEIVVSDGLADTFSPSICVAEYYRLRPLLENFSSNVVKLAFTVRHNSCIIHQRHSVAFTALGYSSFFLTYKITGFGPDLPIAGNCFDSSTE